MPVIDSLCMFSELDSSQSDWITMINHSSDKMKWIGQPRKLGLRSWPILFNHLLRVLFVVNNKRKVYPCSARGKYQMITEWTAISNVGELPRVPKNHIQVQQAKDISSRLSTSSIKREIRHKFMSQSRCSDLERRQSKRNVPKKRDTRAKLLFC